MHELTLAQVAFATNGLAQGDAQIIVRGIATDSRLVSPGDLYCAIIGDRVDGHDYIDQALENGATAVMMSRSTGHAGVIVPPSGTPLDAVIVALGNLARYQRTLMPNVVVVGVTGSSGKTSTKDIIGQVLEETGVTHAPIGSPNNENDHRTRRTKGNRRSRVDSVAASQAALGKRRRCLKMRPFVDFLL